MSWFRTPGLAGWFFFAALCLVTGGTFVCMKVAVGPQNGLPVFLLSASRFTLAGSAVLLALLAIGNPIRLTLKQTVLTVVSGVLLCTFATGFATLGSRSASAGIVSLCFALGPVFVALIESVFLRRRLPITGWMGVVCGVIGVGILVFCSGPTALPTDVGTVAVLLLGPIAYAVGAVVAKRTGVPLWPMIGWQMTVGSIPFWAAAVAEGEEFMLPTLSGWVAWAYLTAVSSVAGLAVYTMALRRLSTPAFMSHSWVLPVVTAAFAALFLGEQFPFSALPGAALILGGLVLMVLPSRTPKSGGLQSAANSGQMSCGKWQQFWRNLAVSLGAFHS